MFTDYESVAQIAPGGIFFDTCTINCDNPLMPAQHCRRSAADAAADRGRQTVPMYIGRRNVEGGGRQQ